MLNRQVVNSLIMAAILTIFTVVGCQTLHDAGVPGLESYLKPDTEEIKATQQHRDNFTLNRDHKALYWLMANRITNSMTLNEVEQILGEQGERETDAARLKSNGPFQTADLCYKWGPDCSGYSVVLFFRDGHLCNFNPKDFSNP
jgi:hypothetical protein